MTVQNHTITRDITLFRTVGQRLFGHPWRRSLTKALNLKRNDITTWEAKGTKAVPFSVWKDLNRLYNLNNIQMFSYSVKREADTAIEQNKLTAFQVASALKTVAHAFESTKTPVSANTPYIAYTSNDNIIWGIGYDANAALHDALQHIYPDEIHFLKIAPSTEELVKAVSDYGGAAIRFEIYGHIADTCRQ